MGAWGLGLFQSDHDLDVVQELDKKSMMIHYDMMFRSLQKATIMERLEKQAANKQAGEGDGADDRAKKEKEEADEGFLSIEFNHSLYAPECTQPRYIRLKIEEEPNTFNEGPSMVKQLVAHLMKEMEDEQLLRNPYGAGYKLVILGACLMTLGCTLPEDLKATLKRIYTQVGLMRDALKQMDKALNGPGSFQDGVEYDFASKNLKDTQFGSETTKSDRLYPGSTLINVASPDTFAPQSAIDKLSTDRKKRREEEKATLDALGKENLQVCTRCGTSETVLLHCSRCRKVKYCGRNCQRGDWVSHKMFCSIWAQSDPYKNAFIGMHEQRMEDSGWKDRLVNHSPEELAKMRETEPERAALLAKAQEELGEYRKRGHQQSKH